MVEFDTNSRGIRLRACRWGNPEMAPILILHGWLDQAYSWAKVAEGLADSGRCVYAIDQRGHGLSDHAPRHSQYHFVDYVADVDAWLTANAISSVNLIGHSMGGTVASLVAANCVDKIASLTLVEGLGAPLEQSNASSERYLKHLQQRRLSPQGRVFLSHTEAAKRLCSYHSGLDHSFANALASRILTPCDGGFRWTWDQRHKHKSAMTMPCALYHRLLSNITAPTAFIQGSDSHYSAVVDLERRLSCIGSLHSRTTLAGGHNLHFDAPVALSHFITTWLDLLT